jgi:hypothetical protein
MQQNPDRLRQRTCHMCNHHCDDPTLEEVTRVLPTHTAHTAHCGSCAREFVPGFGFWLSNSLSKNRFAQSSGRCYKGSGFFGAKVHQKIDDEVFSLSLA